MGVLELSDRICSCYTNLDIIFIQNFAWTRQTIINETNRDIDQANTRFSRKCYLFASSV